MGTKGRVLRVITFSLLSGTPQSGCSWWQYREITGRSRSFHPKAAGGEEVREPAWRPSHSWRAVAGSSGD